MSNYVSEIDSEEIFQKLMTPAERISYNRSWV